MSWLIKIKDSLSITMGNGDVFKPFWVNASKSKEFNTSEFEFVELAGTLVDRRKPKGNRYTLEIHFQGDDHLEQSEKFYNASDDERYWVLQHPVYGIINVQPLSINQDNSLYNISKFTIPIVETIIDINPKTSISKIDSIAVTKLNLDNSNEEIIITPLSSTDKNTLKDTNKKSLDLSVPIITIPEEFENIMNVFNEANSFIDTATASPLLAMRSTISLLTAPAKLTANVQTRVNTLIKTFNDLRTTVVGITSVSGKEIYQVLGSSIISSVCLSVTTPFEGDFSNSKKVSNILNQLNVVYNNYLQDLDSLQSLNGRNALSFIPNFNSLSSLNDLVNITSSYLFSSIISAKKERSIILESDSNIVILTHRFYGLDINDNNIDELIENNELSLDELVIIKKGRKIIYYI